MANVRRVFVQKRAGFDVEARHMLADMRENLGLEALDSVTIAHRYDVEGLTGEEYARAKDQIFREPMVDDALDEHYPLPEGSLAFAVEYLPGQYDQRADSAEQCIELITGRRGRVRTARLIVLVGWLTSEQFERAKQYIINPVESREAAMDKPDTLAADYPSAPDIQVVAGFIGKTDAEIADLRLRMGAAMTQADLLCVQAYFRDEEKRDPTFTELRVIDTYWSDHCRHTTFLTTLDEVTFGEGPLADAIRESYLAYRRDREELSRQNPECLMDIALTGPRLLKARGALRDVDESEEINACSIRTKILVDGEEQEWLVMFKNETHNHPTEIEPFGGSATCLGGAIRDPLSGRSYVYHAMRVTGSGDPTGSVEDTLPGKLPQRKITQGAASGFSSYGNQIGLATGQVSEIYHPGYVAKRMEIGAVVGAAPLENVVRERPAPGDAILLIGGRTGRDGCGGATGSSKEHTQDSLATCGAEVQKGNPVTERKLQRLFRDPAFSRLVKRCNDFGAGGVSVAIGELAPGLTIDLNKVPRKYEGLDGTELAISESQERMAVVVDAKDVPVVLERAAQENLEATLVATVTEEARLTMLWREQTIVSLSRAFLDTNGAEQHARAHVVAPDPTAEPYRHSATSSREEWFGAVSQLNVASQQGLGERFCAAVGAGSVLMPFGGERQKTPTQAMAARLPLLRGETDSCTVMAHGFDPVLSIWSPYHGAMMAVVESLGRLVATGGDHECAYLTFQEYFERLREDPQRWGKPIAALLGALEAQKQLGVASIGGKDSMSGSFVDIDVPPTLVSFALCVADARRVRSPEFKRPGSRVFYLPSRIDEHSAPDWAYQKELFSAVRDGLAKGELLGAHTVGFGGVAAAIAKMCFGNHLGAQLRDLLCEGLFTPRYGSFVVEATSDWIPGILDALEMGEVTRDPAILAAGDILPLEELLAAYERPLSAVFPIVAGPSPTAMPKVHPVKKPMRKASAKVAQPRVFVTSFPGTNSEVDTARSFERAGAMAQIGVMRNLRASDVEESVLSFEKAIRGAQILALPGGFSAGDEPEGSAKFIVSFLNHPRLKDAITDLIQNRDGLILGICNGFQALVKLGLLPYGEYRAMREDAPTLTFNTIGRHISHMAGTRVASCLSPWYALSRVGQVRKVVLSHGEGRFVAPEEEIERLAAAGQIVTQYCDLAGEASADPRYNLNGSMAAIEGICSPDGRILGKMGHSERMAPGLGINIPGDKDENIFEAGVAYYG